MIPAQMTITELVAIDPRDAGWDMLEEVRSRRDVWAALCADSVLDGSPLIHEDAERYRLCRDWIAAFHSAHGIASGEAAA